MNTKTLFITLLLVLTLGLIGFYFLSPTEAHANDCLGLEPLCSFDMQPVCVCSYANGGVLTPTQCYWVCVGK